jgi:glycosyltransferase involved in cell wall biosynthesis
MPIVSVVIPTLKRPEIVQVAIESVLTQTLSDLELIVVVDGLDLATEAALAKIADSRLRVVVNPVNVGLAEARNVGVRHATAPWIAFLDDDDEWLPEKLAKQVRAAEPLSSHHIFVVTRFIERSATMERILPDILPHSAENFSEYMYVQKGFLLPSSFFASRQLMLDVPFTAGLRHIEDIDWLLRATSSPSLQIGAVPDALVIYNDINVATRESKNVPWTAWHNWALTHRSLLTARAFSVFISKHCVRAAREGKENLSVFLYLFATALFLGSMTLDCFIAFLAWGLFPAHVRRQVRRLFSSDMRRSTRLLSPAVSGRTEK